MNTQTPPATETRVLVVDDDTLIAGLLKGIVGRMGCQVNCLHDGNDVLDALPQLAPDVIFLDLVMPGLDGIEVLGILGEVKCKAKLVLMSGMDKRTLSAASAVAQSHDLEVIGAITKPFTVKGVEEIIRPHLGTFERTKAARPAKAQEFGFGPQLLIEPQSTLRESRASDLHWVNTSLVWKLDNGEIQSIDALLAESGKNRSAMGLISFVLRELEYANLKWQKYGLKLGFCIPLANDLLHDAGLPDFLAHASTQCHLDPAAIMFEVNDTAVMDTSIKIYDLLSRIKIKGFRTALVIRKHSDQILAMLNKLAVDELVVDMGYGYNHDQTLNDPEVEFQLSSLVSVALKSGVTSSVMNVSNAAQLNFAKRCKIGRARGSSIRAPGSAEAVVGFYK